MKSEISCVITESVITNWTMKHTSAEPIVEVGIKQQRQTLRNISPLNEPTPQQQALQY